MASYNKDSVKVSFNLIQRLGRTDGHHDHYTTPTFQSRGIIIKSNGWK
jgi:hypothetical protein